MPSNDEIFEAVADDPRRSTPTHAAHWVPTAEEALVDKFDVIVIGGGPAGENVAGGAPSAGARSSWSRPSSSEASARTGRACRARRCSARARRWPRSGGCPGAAGGRDGRDRRGGGARGATRSSPTGTTTTRRGGSKAKGRARPRPRPLAGERRSRSRSRTAPPRELAATSGRARHRVGAAARRSAGSPATRLGQPRGHPASEVPSASLVLGGGVVGVEMAQAWKRLGVPR